MSSSSSSSSSASGSAAEADNAKEPEATKDVDAEVIASGSSSASGSASSSESEKKKKKKKKKPKKEKKKKGKKKKNKKDKKGKKKGKKEKGKKAKKGKTQGKRKQNNLGSSSNQFGKFGIIKVEDFFGKKPEFLLWAMEVKKENTDQMGQMMQRDLFKEFVEDYNTATMPHKKYYNLQSWDNSQTAKRDKKSRGEAADEARQIALTSFDDELARKEEFKHLQAKKHEQSINDEVRKLRANKEKVNEMRHQDHLRVHMDMMNRSGNTDVADKIAKRLDPTKDEFGRPLRRE